MSGVVKSIKRTYGPFIEVVATTDNYDHVAEICNEPDGDRHIGGLLLPYNKPIVDNGDGTYTHTYWFNALRYIDERILSDVRTDQVV